MMPNRKIISYLLLAVLAFGIIIALFVLPSNSEKAPAGALPITFRQDGILDFLQSEDGAVITSIDIEMADEVPERMQGLKYRKNMKENRGMFFVFDREQPQSFWMQDTHISLDIMYVNSALRIVDIAKNTTPYSEAPIPSSSPAQYVVEVIAGFSEKYGVQEGDLIRTRAAQ